MSKELKQYRLLKELFNWTTGHIVPIGELFKQVPQTRNYHSKNGWYVSEAACLNKEYFEEVPVVSENVKERYIVEGLFHMTAPYKDNVYGIHLNQPLPENDFYKIKQAIEDCLNESDTIDIDWKPLPVTEKFYKKSEVDDIRKEAEYWKKEFYAASDRLHKWIDQQHPESCNTVTNNNDVQVPLSFNEIMEALGERIMKYDQEQLKKLIAEKLKK